MEVLDKIATSIALGLEFAAAILIGLGAIEALVLVVASVVRPYRPGARRDAWRRFGTWLLLALEFELGADIIRSAVSPNWTDIGQLAAIAVIRTFLNFFLERDIEAGSTGT